MSEIITIVDPGWDWFQFGVFMTVPVVVAFLALVCLGISRLQSDRERAVLWRDISTFGGFGSLVLVAVCAIAAGVTGTMTYSDHHDNAILASLNENGYDAVQLVDTDGQITLFINTDATMGSLMQIDGDSWQVTEMSK